MEFLNAIGPILISALLGALGMYVSFVRTLQTEVAVLKEVMKQHSSDIESIRKRQDSHSKKQDDIINMLTDIKVEVAKQIGTLGSEMNTLSSDVRALSKLFSVSDMDIVIKRKDS